MDANEGDRLTEEGFDNLSFAGCGFLGIYHVGVASCFREYAPHMYAQRVSGASAGALVACALVTGCCLGECTTFTLKLALQARSRTLGPLSPSFHLVENLRQALWNFLPSNAHEIASGRLFVSLTRVRDQKNVLVSQFTDKNDLIDALICSCFIPLYCGIIPPSYHGVRYVDGAFSDNIPVCNRGTITVSPFAGESDICPDDLSCNLHHFHLNGTSFQFTAGNLYRLSVAFFPPTPEILSNMCKQGFEDALKFLKRNRLISCTQHLSIKSDLISSSPFEFDLFDEEVTEDVEHSKEVSYSIAVNPVSSDDDDDDDSCCDECERELLALRNSPPLPVVTALQAACDEANNGIMAKIYKSRVYQVLSLLATPYVLPFEVAYQLIKRFYDWAPYMPEDMQWFTKGLYKLCVEFFNSRESGIKHEGGRWQLDHFVVSMGVYFGIQAKHRRHRKSSSHHGRHSTGRPPIAFDQNDRLNHPDESDFGCSRQMANPSQRYADCSLDESNHSYSVNFGININYVQSPVQCVRNIRGRLTDHEQTQRRKESVALDAEEDFDGRESPLGLSSRSHELSNELFDTFDNCLNISKQMDSVLAYYYLEENDPTKVKVVEIFSASQPSSVKQDE